MSSDYWRKKNPPKHYTDEDYLQEGKRTIAVRRLNQSVKNGTLRRSPVCWTCGQLGKTQGHHYKGYDYPFDVWWLCRRCNVNLKGKHDGSLSLERARQFLIDKYFVQPERFYKWLARQTEDCYACGVSDKVGVMNLMYDDYERGKWILCEHCCYLMTGNAE